MALKPCRECGKSVAELWCRRSHTNPDRGFHRWPPLANPIDRRTGLRLAFGSHGLRAAAPSGNLARASHAARRLSRRYPPNWYVFVPLYGHFRRTWGLETREAFLATAVVPGALHALCVSGTMTPVQSRVYGALFPLLTTIRMPLRRFRAVGSGVGHGGIAAADPLQLPLSRGCQ